MGGNFMDFDWIDCQYLEDVRAVAGFDSVFRDWIAEMYRDMFFGF